MHGLLTELRYALRMLLKRAGTSALAIVALGLGIGLTATMFSIVNGAILRGLPFDESDSILHLARVRPAVSDDDFEVSLHDYVDWRDRQQVFSQLAAFRAGSAVVSGSQGAERYRSARMTANTLSLLRVTPERGRNFSPADEQPGAPAVMLIGHRVWQTQFESDPAVVGRVVRVNGAPAEVIGVMPPRFSFPVSESVWLPLTIDLPAVRGEGTTFEVLGRLNPGVSKTAARTAMETIAAQLAASHVENKGITVQMKGYIEEFIGGEVIATLFAMLGAVFGVLLIACANVTNLQLARALERTKELAIRSAMGAERWRIVRQMLIEGAVLSVVGAVLGIAIAQTGVTLFNYGIADTSPPFWIDIRVDWTVLAFVSALTVTAALLSTVVPALRATRGGAIDVLKDQSRGTTSLRAGVMTRVLVGGAVTLSCALLIVSGLMIKSVVELGRAQYPFAIEDVLLARTQLDETAFPTDASIMEFVDRLSEQAGGVAGVRRAAVATSEPLGGGAFYLTKEGQTFEKPEDQPSVRRIAATGPYFDALQLRPVSGRVFSDADRAGTLPVVVITEDLATRYFAGADPIGQRVRLGRNQAFPWWTIVGIVPRLSSAPQGDSIMETAFVPLSQAPDRVLTIVAATTGDPLAAAPGLRQAIRRTSQDVPTFGLEPFATYMARRAWPFRVFGTLFMAFGVAALAMAVAGLYGVLAFTVRLRTQEIGVRMALGAERAGVARMIVRQGMTVVCVGLASGLILGGLLSPLMSTLFFNVQPLDPMVFGTTTVLLLVTGFVASIVPALRAASVDPLVALRES